MTLADGQRSGSNRRLERGFLRVVIVRRGAVMKHRPAVRFGYDHVFSQSHRRLLHSITTMHGNVESLGGVPARGPRRNGDYRQTFSSKRLDSEIGREHDGTDASADRQFP